MTPDDVCINGTRIRLNVAHIAASLWADWYIIRPPFAQCEVHWILRSTKFHPPFLERHRSLFFDKYLKLPETIVKPYLPKVGQGIMIFDPTIVKKRSQLHHEHFLLD